MEQGELPSPLRPLASPLSSSLSLSQEPFLARQHQWWLWRCRLSPLVDPGTPELCSILAQMWNAIIGALYNSSVPQLEEDDERRSPSEEALELSSSSAEQPVAERSGSPCSSGRHLEGSCDSPTCSSQIATSMHSRLLTSGSSCSLASQEASQEKDAPNCCDNPVFLDPEQSFVERGMPIRVDVSTLRLFLESGLMSGDTGNISAWRDMESMISCATSGRSSFENPLFHLGGDDTMVDSAFSLNSSMESLSEELVAFMSLKADTAEDPAGWQLRQMLFEDGLTKPGFGLSIGMDGSGLDRASAAVSRNRGKAVTENGLHFASEDLNVNASRCAEENGMSEVCNEIPNWRQICAGANAPDNSLAQL